MSDCLVIQLCWAVGLSLLWKGYKTRLQRFSLLVPSSSTQRTHEPVDGVSQLSEVVLRVSVEARLVGASRSGRLGVEEEDDALLASCKRTRGCPGQVLRAVLTGKRG